MSNPYQRYSVTVPNPKAWLVLGEPDDIGYKGVSLGADDNAFLSVKGSTLTQAKGQVSHMAWMEWVQSSGGDMTLNTGGNHMVASKRQIVLAAGAGYSPDLQLENGIGVPKAYFNPYDYKAILDPCRNGVRAFDDALELAFEDFKTSAGYPATPGAPSAAAAALTWKLKLLKVLCGLPQPPTENSDSIEQFSRKHEGLWGAISTLRHMTDRIERWTSRPDTLPLVGPVVDAGKSVQLAMQGATTAASTLASLPVMLGLQSSPDGSKGGISSEYGREMAEASGKNQMIEHGTGARTWADQGGAAAELAGTGFQHLLRPIANRVRALSYALASMRNAIEAIANLLGVPRPSSLALVGKDGVSIVSPKRVFGYAADGFHFVTSDPMKSPPSKWDVLAKIQEAGDAAAAAIREKLLGAAKQVDPVPGFEVRSQGDFDVRAMQDVNLWAVGDTSLARLTAGYAAEVSAMSAVALSSRNGTAEVLARELVLGTKVDRAKGSAVAASLAPAVGSTNGAMMAAIDEANAAGKKVEDKTEELRLLTLDASGNEGTAFLGDPVKLAKASNLRAEIAALKLEVAAKNAAVTVAKSAAEAAFDAYQQALPAFESRVAKAMDWQEPGNQSVTNKLEMASADTMDVFGREVTVGASKSITLQAEPPIPDPLAQATVTLQSKKVEIDVGAKFTVVVSDQGIAIRSPAGAILETDGTTATVQIPGGGSVKITAAGIELKGATTKVSAEMVTVAGQIINVG